MKKRIPIFLLVLLNLFTMQRHNSHADTGFYQWKLFRGYAEYEESGKIGVINAKGVVVLPAEHDEIFRTDFANYIIFRKDGKYGVLGSLDKIITPNIWDKINTYSNYRLFRVCLDGKYGYMDENGNILIEPSFDASLPPEGGYIPVMNNDKWGYLKVEELYSQTVECEFIWDSVSSVNDDLSCASLDGIPFILNHKTNTTIRVNSDYIQVSAFTKGYMIFMDTVRYGIMNSIGEITVLPKYYINTDCFDESGLLVVIDTKISRIGVINGDGEIIVPFVGMTDYSSIYKEGLLFMMTDRSCNDDVSEYTCFDTNGNTVFKISAKWTDGFSDGLARVVMADGRIAYINPLGEIALGPLHESVTASSFSEGLASFTTSRGSKFGFMNKKGEIIVDEVWDWVSDYENGLAQVRSYGSDEPPSNRTKGYIDITGDMISGIKIICNDLVLRNDE